jgi:FAD/FMN-containing dehydrogenase
VSESERVTEELQSLVPGRVVTNVKAYLRDSWSILSISQEEEGSALVAVRPMNVEEVAKVVKYAAANKLRILYRG